MLILLLTILLLLIVFYSLGEVLSYRLNIQHQVLWSDSIFTGMAISNTFFSLWSLFLPCDIVSFSVFLTLGIGALIVLWNKHRLDFLKEKKDIKIVILLAIGLLTISLASALEIYSYDSALYHVQSVQWIEAYGCVPGLGNLHDRLAFNSNVFTLFAGTNGFHITKEAIYAINGLGFFVGCAYSISMAFRTTNVFRIIFYLSLVLLFLYINIWLMSAPAPDVIIGVLVLYVLIRYLDERKPSPILIFVISVYAVTIKLNAIPLLLIPLLLFSEQRQKSLIRQLIPAVLLAAAIALPWLIRNYVLSGYLIFPFPALDLFHPDWKVPAHIANTAKDAIMYWAKLPYTNEYLDTSKHSFSVWFPIWAGRMPMLYKILFAGIVVSVLLLIVRYRSAEASVRKLMIVCCIAIVYWFLLAPDVRFATSFIAVLGLSSLLLFSFHISQHTSAWLICAVMTLMCLRMDYSILKMSQLTKQTFLTPGGFSEEANIEYHTVTIDHQKIYFPVISDRCYEQELPCTNAVQPGLRLRGNSLKEGFRIE